ncbi:ABC transporter permease [Methanocella sp. MCL-LM]|uniref:ABC transporter permease n=1 Tax=Methanocella sp. MCL-LM TaxID=3412035 RepID=UPI003C78F8C2
MIKKIALTDLKIRYKNSVLGFLWSLLQPLAMMVVLYIVFTNLFKNEAIDNYPLYLMIGLISWGFFEKATNFSLNSIVGKANLVKKIYFPREVLVISACLTALIMSLIEFGIIAMFILVNGIVPSWQIVLFPAVLFIEFILVLGISLAIASLNVRYRDVQWIWAVFLQVGFFLTPIMYSIRIFKDTTVANLISLNPMGVIMDLMRDVIIRNTIPSWLSILSISAFSLVVLAVGWIVFRQIDPTFAEEV